MEGKPFTKKALFSLKLFASFIYFMCMCYLFLRKQNWYMCHLQHIDIIYPEIYINRWITSRAFLESAGYLPSALQIYCIPSAPFCTCVVNLGESNQQVSFLLVSSWDHPMWSPSRISEERSMILVMYSLDSKVIAFLYISLSFWFLTVPHPRNLLYLLYTYPTPLFLVLLLNILGLSLFECAICLLLEPSLIHVP